MFERLLTKLYVAGETVAQRARIPGFRRPSYDEVVGNIYSLKGQLFEKSGLIQGYSQSGAVLTGLDLHLAETRVIQKDLMKNIMRVKHMREYKDQDADGKLAISTPAEEDGLWKSFRHLKTTEKIAGMYFADSSYNSYLETVAEVRAREGKSIDDYIASVKAKEGIVVEAKTGQQSAQQLLVPTRPEIFSMRRYLATSPALKMYGPSKDAAAGGNTSGAAAGPAQQYKRPSDDTVLTSKLYDKMTFSGLNEKTLIDRALKGGTGKGVHKYWFNRRDKDSKTLMDELAIIGANVADEKTKDVVSAVAIRHADYMVKQFKRIDKALVEMGYITGFSMKTVGEGKDATPEYMSHLNKILDSPDEFAKFYGLALKREGKRSKSNVFDDLMGQKHVDRALKKAIGKGLTPDRRMSETMEDVSVIFKNDDSGYVKDAIRKVMEGVAHEYQIVDKAAGSVYKGKYWMDQYAGSFMSLVGTVGEIGKLAGELYKARSLYKYTDSVAEQERKSTPKRPGKMDKVIEKIETSLEGRQSKKNRKDEAIPARAPESQGQLPEKEQPALPGPPENAKGTARVVVSSRPWRALPAENFSAFESDRKSSAPVRF